MLQLGSAFWIPTVHQVLCQGPAGLNLPWPTLPFSSSSGLPQEEGKTHTHTNYPPTFPKVSQAQKLEGDALGGAAKEPRKAFL